MAAAEEVLQRLEELGDEYQDLCKKENELEELLSRLKREEVALTTAIAQVQPRPTMMSQGKSDQREAMKRLEEALMQELSSDSSDTSSADGTESGKNESVGQNG